MYKINETRKNFICYDAMFENQCSSLQSLSCLNWQMKYESLYIDTYRQLQKKWIFKSSKLAESVEIRVITHIL